MGHGPWSPCPPWLCQAGVPGSGFLAMWLPLILSSLLWCGCPTLTPWHRGRPSLPPLWLLPCVLGLGLPQVMDLDRPGTGKRQVTGPWAGHVGGDPLFEVGKENGARHARDFSRLVSIIWSEARNDVKDGPPEIFPRVLESVYFLSCLGNTALGFKHHFFCLPFTSCVCPDSRPPPKEDPRQTGCLLSPTCAGLGAVCALSHGDAGSSLLVPVLQMGRQALM